MARCDQGYICDVCGEEVKSIRNSDLYLRYVTGEIDSRQLLAAPERHILCNPVAAQFIEHPDFVPVTASGPFCKDDLDSGFVQERVNLLTRGWVRLQELGSMSQRPAVSDYPLPEVRNPGSISTGQNDS